MCCAARDGMKKRWERIRSLFSPNCAASFYHEIITLVALELELWFRSRSAGNHWELSQGSAFWADRTCVRSVSKKIKKIKKKPVLLTLDWAQGSSLKFLRVLMD
jgi:hypothetical protein